MDTDVNDNFSFTVPSIFGQMVDVNNAVQIGVFAVHPVLQLQHDQIEGEHMVTHWPTGFALCRAIDFNLAMLIADDASRNTDVAHVALVAGNLHKDVELETDDVAEAGRLIGSVVLWIRATSEPVYLDGKAKSVRVTHEKYKSYREWRCG